ncbi:MAG: EAL domain-containing protein [Pseudomonadota bacterium]
MRLESFLQSFARLTQDSVIVIYSPAPDVEGSIVWCNDAFSKAFGHDDVDTLGNSISTLFEPVRYRAMLDEIRPDMIEGETGANAEVSCLRADGTTFWGNLQILYAPRDETGGRSSAGIIRDISNLKQREAKAAEALDEREAMAREAEALWSRLLLAIDSLDAPIGIWDKNQRLVICNKSFGPRLMGRPMPSEPDLTFQDFLREAAYAGTIMSTIGREEEWIAEAIAAMETGYIDNLETFSDGRAFLAKSELSANGDMVIHNIEMTDAIARERELSQKNQELAEAEQDARRRANRDDLTGLGNRRYMGACLDMLIEQYGDETGEIALLQIDLDRFKQINDTLGHAAGDHVLVVVSQRLTALLGVSDHLARIGGDEFVIIGSGQNIEDRARRLGAEIIEALSRPILFNDTSLRIGASVGIATTPISSGRDLLVHADVALYRSKSEGRGHVRVFDHTDLDKLRRSKAVGDEILIALEARQFVPWFQPQIDAATGQIVGLEALARWNHPERGILPPAIFIQQADDLNVLGELDRLIFETAIEACSKAFEGIPALDLSINVSEERLMSSDIDTFLKQAAAYPGKIAMELLETIFLEDRGETFRFQIDRLRDAGIGIELDDFGSGRASIVGLEQIAPDRLKIDRRLVGSAATSERSARLLRAIVDIGDALDIKVTAEGIETADQVKVLTALGCERLQGFWFGPPMPLDDVIRRFDLRPSLQRHTGS